MSALIDAFGPDYRPPAGLPYRCPNCVTLREPVCVHPRHDSTGAPLPLTGRAAQAWARDGGLRRQP